MFMATVRPRLPLLLPLFPSSAAVSSSSSSRPLLPHCFTLSSLSFILFTPSFTHPFFCSSFLPLVLYRFCLSSFFLILSSDLHPLLCLLFFISCPLVLFSSLLFSLSFSPLSLYHFHPVPSFLCFSLFLPAVLTFFSLLP